MGHPDPNAGPPTVHLMEAGPMVELAVGCETANYHVATKHTEFLTADQWFDCLSAAKLGWSQLEAALNASNAGTWLFRLRARTMVSGHWLTVRDLLIRRFTTTWKDLNTVQALANPLLAA